jgi:AcrR family transcriptional regulator
VVGSRTARQTAQKPGHGGRRTEIIDAALGLAVAHGFETINLRALAASVGLSTMALYRHVENKDDLLRAMADEVLGAIELPPRTLPWDEWYVVVTFRYWEAMGRYPGLAAYVLAHGPVLQTPGALRVTEEMLAVLLDAGFSPSEAALLWQTAHAYLSGMVLLFQGHTRNGSPGTGRRPDAKRTAGVGAVLDEFDCVPDEHTLEAGLRRLLAGFGHR